MPWKVSHLVNERMQFVTRLNEGERMTDLCREFGISRKTGYKFLDRYKKAGPEGLFDGSRRPVVSPSRVSEELKAIVLKLKHSKPTWGPDKIREQLRRKHGVQGVRIPSRATVHRILDQAGLVRKKKQRSKRPSGEFLHQPFQASQAPNDIWCTDFKGEFRLGNGQYCYPLTLSDHFSRYLLACEALESTKGFPVMQAFEQIFLEHGLPAAILSDNGSPFGSRGLYGLSRLSVWWLGLGIKILRIEPGHPEQNGRHERFHLTLKQETTRPAGKNTLQQQEKFDCFQAEYNMERPHQALQMKCPGEVYVPSTRRYDGPIFQSYPLHELTRPVMKSGVVTLPRRTSSFFLGHAFEGQEVGLREEEERLWRVSYGTFDLGFFDEKGGGQFSPFEQPELSIG